MSEFDKLFAMLDKGTPKIEEKPTTKIVTGKWNRYKGKGTHLTAWKKVSDTEVWVRIPKVNPFAHFDMGEVCDLITEETNISLIYPDYVEESEYHIDVPVYYIDGHLFKEKHALDICKVIANASDYISTYTKPDGTVKRMFKPIN